ncbi:thioredoxin, partial [Burkholderia pseudomallei]
MHVPARRRRRVCRAMPAPRAPRG